MGSLRFQAGPCLPVKPPDRRWKYCEQHDMMIFCLILFQ